jgi:hypothetical protein
MLAVLAPEPYLRIGGAECIVPLSTERTVRAKSECFWFEVNRGSRRIHWKCRRPLRIIRLQLFQESVR